ncbi:MAG: hypothetical protein IJ019_03225 [Alphaproteobacteria bacterium]|nr:hypothetical protein [Alphaproteobacteria bacterium]
MTIYKRIFVLLVTILVTAVINTTKADMLDVDYIYLAAGKGDIDYLSRVGEYNISLETTNKDGDTPLCIAARKKNEKAYNTLIKAGANPNAPCTKNIAGYGEFQEKTMGSIAFGGG